VWEDWRGGIGLYSFDGVEGLNRSSFSRANGRYKGHLTLSALSTYSSDPSVNGHAGALNELGSALYLALDGSEDIYSWTPGNDTWSAKLHDLPAAAVASLRFTLSGTEYVAFAHTGGYSYSSDGSTWADDTQDTVSMAFWDDRLWGIDDNGQLWFSLAIGTETLDANIDLPASHVSTLFVGPDAAGEDILYAATRRGLYAHDAANSRFVRTKAVWPNKAITTTTDSVPVQAATTWNGDIYVSPGGSAVWRYNPTAGTIVSVGLDRDAGIPSAGRRGDIVDLVPTHAGVVAVVDGSSADLAWEYNGIGWHYLAATAAIAGTHHVSDIGGNYRLYFGGADKIFYVDLQTGDVNPDLDTLNYDGTNDLVIHETPWFNAGQNEIDKTAIRVRLDCTGMSANETVDVQYALNYSSTYEAGANNTFQITASGVTEKTFPSILNNDKSAGVAFRSIRFKLILNRGGTTTNTPNVKSLSLEWRRKIPAKYGFSFDVDRTEDYGGRTPQEMKADLITAVESSTLVEFTFVTDTGNTQNYYVDVTQMEDIQDTGQNGEKGATRITVIET
jgi:hypothetical protein